MNNVQNFVPKLTLNKHFIADVMKQTAPCLSLAFVEMQKEKVGFIIMRPDQEIEPQVVANGFRFGSALYGLNKSHSIQLSFDFYGDDTYHSLVNPSNPIARQVLTHMVENGKYLFIVINPSQRAFTFLSDPKQKDLCGLKDNIEATKNTTTPDRDYQLMLTAFRKKPEPPGKMLEWVCHGDINYLDLSSNNTRVISPG